MTVPPLKFCVCGIFAEKAVKCGLVKPMPHFLMLAKKTTNLVKFMGKIIKIP